MDFQCIGPDESGHIGVRVRTPDGDTYYWHTKAAWLSHTMDGNLRAHIGHNILGKALMVFTDVRDGSVRFAQEVNPWSRPPIPSS
jgi:hypothetical protein